MKIEGFHIETEDNEIIYCHKTLQALLDSPDKWAIKNVLWALEVSLQRKQQIEALKEELSDLRKMKNKRGSYKKKTPVKIQTLRMAINGQKVIDLKTARGSLRQM